MSEPEFERETEAEEPTEGITHEMIAERAYEISQLEQAGTPEENWERAERELREERATAAESPAP